MNLPPHPENRSTSLVEGRRPVGRPRRAWIESVESDMPKHEIGRENVHEIKKKENMKDNFQPFRKMDYKPIVYIQDDIILPSIICIICAPNVSENHIT